MKLHDTSSIERAVLAQRVHSRMDPGEAADSLLELGRLADTAGLEVAGQLTQNRDKPDGGTLFGTGKVEDLKALVAAKAANTVVFDNELSAIQAYNLTKALEVRIMDRTEIILEIFARRARSAEAQTQVELAQLEFQLSRIPVTEAQQRFKGGIGMKGPGESHLQLRNAPLRRRIAELKKRLAEIHARQELRGKIKRDWPVVSLVGYTNAGKSSLLNVLSKADAYVDDRLFATLEEIGAQDVPHLLVLNKCDCGTADNAVLHATECHPHAIPVSAKTGYGLDLLKQAIREELQKTCPLWRLPSAASRSPRG